MAKPDWITLSKSSGSGNDTVTVTAAKNTSTTARTGSITVKSGSITETISVSQEGASARGKITLTYTDIGAVPSVDYVGRTLYASIYQQDVEFYQLAGTIYEIEDSYLTIDISDMSESEIDSFYNDFSSGDQLESNTIYFGVSDDEDPTVSWTPILYTEDKGDVSMDYEWTSDNIANIWNDAYNDGTDQTVECTIISTTYAFIGSGNLCKITVPASVFTEAGVTSITFYAQGRTLNDTTAQGSNLTLTYSAEKTSSGYLLMDFNLPTVARDRLSRIEIHTSFNDISATLTGASASNLYFTTTSDSGSTNTAKANFISSGEYVGFSFPTPIGVDINTVITNTTSYTTVNITSLN